MKRTKFSESQIIKILKEYESGVSVEELSRKHGFYPSTLYDWKKKYGGSTDSTLQELKELKRENEELKKMYANISLEHIALKDFIAKKL